MATNDDELTTSLAKSMRDALPNVHHVDFDTYAREVVVNERARGLTDADIVKKVEAALEARKGE